MSWLQGTQREQIEPCLALLDDANAWEQVVDKMGLETAMTLDYHHYLRQTLKRQIDADTQAQVEPAYWLPSAPNEAVWRLCLPATLPAWHLFDLLQLGEWMPQTPLICTPASLVRAVENGYAKQHIRWLVETATQKPLSAQKEKQLDEWIRQGQAYQAQQVTLLSTQQSGQLQEILAQKRWRPYFGQQLSPRHVVVQSELLPQLQAWLSGKGQFLSDKITPKQSASDETSTYHWLGLRVLVGLGELVRLPYPPPYQQLQAAEQDLSGTEKSELERIAQALIENVRTVIRGRDAFWPAHPASAEAWLKQVEQAIEKEQALDIVYQSLGEFKPTYRRIQPLRLEQQGSLYYLHAYCYRVEANLVFRLDRIQEILPEEKNS